MPAFKSAPYHLFALVAFLFAITSSIPSNDAFDVNFHDTYIVIATAILLRGMAFLFLLFWIIYLIAKKLLSSLILMWLHILLSILPAIYFAILMFNRLLLSGAPRRYYVFNEFKSLTPALDANIHFIVIILVFLIGQLFFIANFIRGGLKQFKLA